MVRLFKSVAFKFMAAKFLPDSIVFLFGSVYMELEQFFASEHPCVCFWQNCWVVCVWRPKGLCMMYIFVSYLSKRSLFQIFPQSPDSNKNTRMERVDKIKCWEKMQHTNLYASDFDPTAPKQMDNIVQSMPFTNSTRKYWILTSSYKIGFSTFTDTSCLKKA